VGSNLAKAVRIFQGEKILSTPPFGREVKPWVPCRRFAARKRSLNWCGSCNFRQNYRLILAHIVPLSATRISRVVVDVGVPDSERGNVQTGGGDRVSTISLLGCSTSVALATGPTDDEQEEGHNGNIYNFCLIKQQWISSYRRNVTRIQPWVRKEKWNSWIFTHCISGYTRPHDNECTTTNTENL